ncbi:MAG: peptide chain release factor N(5)-glutamine methyltransferase [Pseudomonadota bacterium]
MSPDILDRDSVPTIGFIIRETASAFAEAGLETPGLDARLLMSHTLSCDGARLVAIENDRLGSHQAELFEQLCERRLEGEPVHRILGHREFWGRHFILNSHTLEPRPDSEVLIEAVLARIDRSGRHDEPLHILDLGTGTGVLGLTLAAELRSSFAILTDISSDALQAASLNAQELGLAKRVSLKKGNWFDALKDCDGRAFDIIVSNPPYIPSGTMSGLQKEVRLHDPVAALDGGNDGLDPYRVIFSQAVRFLTPEGVLVVEHGFDQRDVLCLLAEESGWRVESQLNDLGGNARGLVLTPD